jgi:hypothetical protein
VKEKEYKECAHCTKPVELTVQRKGSMRRYMKMGSPGRVFCDEQCNTEYHNALSREKREQSNAV